MWTWGVVTNLGRRIKVKKVWKKGESSPKTLPNDKNDDTNQNVWHYKSKCMGITNKMYGHYKSKYMVNTNEMYADYKSNV